MALLAAIAGAGIIYQEHQGAEDAQATTATYPDKIINGDFEYPVLTPYVGPTSYVQINPLDHTYFNESKNENGSFIRGTLASNVDVSKIAWRSTQQQNDGAWAHAGDIQFFTHNGNQYVELVSNEANTAIYQDISTPNSGYVYKWQLKHASRDRNAQDSMSVLIGKPGEEKIQTAWRITSNGNGVIDEEMTNIVTDTTLPTEVAWRDGWWETYEGIYVIPKGQSVTRFTFHSNMESSASGNVLDDISFAICHPLYYELNGGKNDKIPIPQASGHYPGYYPEESTQTLTAEVPIREDYTFLGWSLENQQNITSQNQLDNLVLVTDKAIEPGNNYVYAVWGKNPTVTFIDSLSGETVSSFSIPFNTSLSDSDYPIPPEHDYYAFTGFSPILTEPICEDTIIYLEYERTDLIAVPASIEWHDSNDYAKKRPSSVIFTLYADSVKIDEKTVSADDNWSCIFSELPAHAEDGHLIDYRAVREDASGVPTEYDAIDTARPTPDNTTGLHVNATYVETIDIPIAKIWDDMNDVYKERPESIEVVLLGNGDEYDRISLCPPAESESEFESAGKDAINVASSKWNGAFENVPLWDEKEQWIEWSVMEPKVRGYDCIGVTLNADGDLKSGYTIENRIWKQIAMPETGESGLAVLTGIGIAIISIGIVMSTIRRRRKCSQTEK